MCVETGNMEGVVLCGNWIDIYQRPPIVIKIMRQQRFETRSLMRQRKEVHTLTTLCVPVWVGAVAALLLLHILASVA